MKHLGPAIRLFLFLTVLTGLVYPLIVTAVAKMFFQRLASGDIVVQNGAIIGAHQLAQKFVSDKYFWGRPSSVDYNPLPSGGSNLGPTSAALKKIVEERASAIRKVHSSESVPPQLLFASASGLDPDISPETALFQLDRVVRARGLSEEQKRQLIDLIRSSVQKPDLGFLGESRVNVLEINMGLDGIAGPPRS